MALERLQHCSRGCVPEPYHPIVGARHDLLAVGFIFIVDAIFLLEASSD
jgi:hypothetical protein